MNYYREFKPTNSTKAYWKMEGNSNDSSGNGNNGTDTDITYSIANGKVGQGAGFNGSTSKIRNTSPSNLPTGANARTMSAWFYCDTGTTNFKSICDYGSDATRQRFSLHLNNTNPGKLYIVVYDDDYTGSDISLNTWYHFCATYDGNVTINIYLNGKLVGTKTLGAALNTTLNANGVTIGFNNAVDNAFPGKIDEVIIENRAWSSGEISEYYSGSIKSNLLLMGV